MNQPGLVVSFGLVAGLAAALSAQGPSSNGETDQMTIQSIRVKVIGCVTHGSQTGHSSELRVGRDVPERGHTEGSWVR
jgi:hypothetical protein